MNSNPKTRHLAGTSIFWQKRQADLTITYLKNTLFNGMMILDFYKMEEAPI